MDQGPFQLADDSTTATRSPLRPRPTACEPRFLQLMQAHHRSRGGSVTQSRLAGNFDDLDTVTQVRAAYQAARGMINTAAANPSNYPAAKLNLARLASDLEYAVNDLGMSYWLLLGNQEKSEATRNKGVRRMNEKYATGAMEFTKTFASRYGLDLPEDYFYNLLQSKW
jgi:hypothetical protein